MNTGNAEAIIGLVFLLFAIPAGCAFTEWQCTSRAEKMGLKGSWGPAQGCMVQTHKRWLPIESLREIDP